MATVTTHPANHKSAQPTNHKSNRRRNHKNRFDTVAEPFLQGEGLPFSSVLSAESIERAFIEDDLQTASAG